jgi:anaerobic selenocysteine-containing dehydrogenase
MPASKRIVRTICPMNCNPTHCGMLVEVEDDRVLSIVGDIDNPDSRGFLCMRGHATREIPRNPLRLLSPLQRVGKRGEDRWQEISWEEAYDLIIEHIEKSSREHVGIWLGHGALTTSSVRPLLMRFGQLAGFNVWNPAMICWALGAYGLALTGIIEANTKEDMAAHASTILFWGANLASQPTTAPSLIEARKRGAYVVHIDCRRNEASRHADEVYLIRPGTDAALALAMAHVIVTENLTDTSFLDKHTLGFADFAEHLTSHTPEWAAEITGISAERIRSLARRYATRHPAMIVLGGSSPFKHHAGWEVGRAIACLPALTGQIGIVGGGFGPRHRAFVHADGLTDLQAAHQRPPGAYIPNHMASIVQAIQDGRINTLFLLGSNMLSSFSDTTTLEKSFKNIGLIVAYDIFMNETMRRAADIILPGTIWLEERGLKDTATHLYLMEQALQPDGEARSLLRLMRDLAERLVVPDFFPWHDEEAYINALLAPQHTKDGTALTMEMLRQHGGIWQKSRLSHVSYPDLHFHTPSGKVEFRSARAQSVGLPALPTYTPPHVDSEPAYPLQFRQGRTLTAFHAFYDEGRALPSLARANREPELWMNPIDAQQREITANSSILIYNEQGQLRARARVTEQILPGVVWMRDGWIGLNSLTNGTQALSPAASDVIDPLAIPGGQTAFDAQVEVCKAPPPVRHPTTISG